MTRRGLVAAAASGLLGRMLYVSKSCRSAFPYRTIAVVLLGQIYLLTSHVGAVPRLRYQGAGWTGQSHAQ